MRQPIRTQEKQAKSEALVETPHFFGVDAEGMDNKSEKLSEKDFKARWWPAADGEHWSPPNKPR